LPDSERDYKLPIVGGFQVLGSRLRVLLITTEGTKALPRRHEGTNRTQATKTRQFAWAWRTTGGSPCTMNEHRRSERLRRWTCGSFCVAQRRSSREDTARKRSSRRRAPASTAAATRRTYREPPAGVSGHRDSFTSGGARR
jgi:hypothetical protein